MRRIDGVHHHSSLSIAVRPEANFVPRRVTQSSHDYNHGPRLLGQTVFRDPPDDVDDVRSHVFSSDNFYQQFSPSNYFSVFRHQSTNIQFNYCSLLASIFAYSVPVSGEYWQRMVCMNFGIILQFFSHGQYADTVVQVKNGHMNELLNIERTLILLFITNSLINMHYFSECVRIFE